MLLGIGTDIVELERVRKALENQRFVERVYTEGEREYCEGRGAQRTASYAARWAGKEAVLKAFGTGLREGKLTEIEILPDELGCPQVTLAGVFAEMAQRRGARLQVSLSHARAFATAVCIMEGAAPQGTLQAGGTSPKGMSEEG